MRAARAELAASPVLSAGRIARHERTRGTRARGSSFLQGSASAADAGYDHRSRVVDSQAPRAITRGPLSSFPAPRPSADRARAGPSRSSPRNAAHHASAGCVARTTFDCALSTGRTNAAHREQRTPSAPADSLDGSHGILAIDLESLYRRAAHEWPRAHRRAGAGSHSHARNRPRAGAAVEHTVRGQLRPPKNSPLHAQQKAHQRLLHVQAILCLIPHS
jgi:hypothetical protein